jgi:hypothetical protein
MKFQMEVDIPEGYEATGEYRRPDRCDHWLDSNSGSAKVACGPVDFRKIILRKIPVYVPLGPTQLLELMLTQRGIKNGDGSYATVSTLDRDMCVTHRGKYYSPEDLLRDFTFMNGSKVGMIEE